MAARSNLQTASMQRICCSKNLSARTGRWKILMSVFFRSLKYASTRAEEPTSYFEVNFSSLL